MASFMAIHKKGCALGQTAAPESKDDSITGCTCKPTYASRYRDGDANRFKTLGRDRTEALRKLGRLRDSIEQGEDVSTKNLRFDAWAEKWLGSLECKANSVDSYRATVAYANAAFGSKKVRAVRVLDIVAVNKLMRDGDPKQNLRGGLADSSRAKHLRVLAACFKSAIGHGYAAQNPVAFLPKPERPRPEKNEAAYFTNDELPRLFEQIPEGLYRTLCLVALKTGMRQGELVALTWADVDLDEGLVRVRRNYTAGRLTGTKNREKRNVDLSPDVVELLKDWWISGPGGSELVFPAEAGCGYIPSWVFTKNVLYPAMKRANIARVGVDGGKRTFHSFRHTFGKVTLEKGRPLTWVSRQLGHSSVVVTDGVYGHWERKTSKAEAKRMKGAFAV